MQTKPFFSEEFIDKNHEGFSMTGSTEGAVKSDFPAASRNNIGLYGITVWNNDGETAVTLHCRKGVSDPSPLRTTHHGSDTFLRKTAQGYDISNMNWHGRPGADNPMPELPKDSIAMNGSAGPHVDFYVTDSKLKETGIANGLRQFVESLGLPNTTKLQVTDAIAQARDASNEKN